MRLLHILATVGLLTSVGVTIVDAAEPSQSGPPLMVPVAADGVQRATVTLDSYSYTPNHLTVEAGKPVELTLTSVTTLIPHNFIIKDPAGRLSVEQDVGAGKPNHDLNRDSLSCPAVSGLNWGVGLHVFAYRLSFHHRVLSEPTIGLIGMRNI